MLNTNGVKLKDIYKVLHVLKANKYVTRTELASKANVNIKYVTYAIQYLCRQQYNIEVVQGKNGGYIYDGKKKKIILERKISKIDKGICDLYKDDNVKISDIEELTNRSRPAIYYQLNKHKIKLYKKPQKYDGGIIKELYESGKSIKDIAYELNISYKLASSTIYRFVKGNRRHKIDNREEIKQYIVDNPNVRGREIAKKFNVSQGTITYLKRELKGIKRGK